MPDSVALDRVTLRLSDGYAAAARVFRPAGTPRGAAVYLHGIQSHGGWYEASGRALAEAGWLVVVPDRRGSGANAAARGDAPSAEQVLADVRTAMAFAADHARDAGATLAGVDLLGVSWGGKLALCVAGDAAGEPAVRSVTLIAPGLCPQVDVPWRTKLAVATALLTGQAGRLLPLPLADPALFTADPARQRQVGDDPLALHAASARLLWISRLLDRHARRARDRLARAAGPPVHLVLAGRDRIVDNARTQAWLAPLGPRCTVTLLPAASHTLEFDPDPGAYVAAVTTWLAAPGGASAGHPAGH